LSNLRHDFHHELSLHKERECAAIEFNAPTGRGFELVAFGRSSLWKNLLAWLAINMAKVWAEH
jgi:hypothetical protein